MDSRPEALHRPASEVEDGYWWGESQEVHIKSWRGKAGDSQMTTEPRQHEQLAVLLPCWSDCAQGSILVLYLSNLLRQQGIPFRIHLLEQVGSALFNPGLLLNTGFQLALKTDGNFVPDYIAALRPNLMPYTNVSFEYPSSPFLHLATEQSLYNSVLPYDSYCGGAWVAHVGFFQRLGGLASAYVGYEGVEDDLCRRVLHQLGATEVPQVGAGKGMFTVVEETPELMQLAEAHREHNGKVFKDRWGDAQQVSITPQSLLDSGLGSVPKNWPQLLARAHQSEVHSWWRVKLPELVT